MCKVFHHYLNLHIFHLHECLLHLCFISKPPNCCDGKIMTILKPVPETVDVYADSRIAGIRIWSPDIVHKLHAGEYLVWVRKQLI